MIAAKTYILECILNILYTNLVSVTGRCSKRLKGSTFEICIACRHCDSRVNRTQKGKMASFLGSTGNLHFNEGRVWYSLPAPSGPYLTHSITIRGLMLLFQIDGGTSKQAVLRGGEGCWRWRAEPSTVTSPPPGVHRQSSHQGLDQKRCTWGWGGRYVAIPVADLPVPAVPVSCSPPVSCIKLPTGLIQYSCQS